MESNNETQENISLLRLKGKLDFITSSEFEQKFNMGLDNFSMLEYMLSYGKQRKKQVLKSVAHFRAKIQGNSEVFWP